VPLVPRSQEIVLLNDLIRATCYSADRCADAARVCDGYRRMVLEQMCEDRRLLLIDLVRCLLLRGLPVPEVQESITAVPAHPATLAGVDVMWINVEFAERKLHLTLRGIIEDPAVTDPVKELLSVHYLRLKLHHDELDGVAASGPVATDGLTNSFPSSSRTSVYDA
jgi:hypothetical protein